MTRDDAVCCVGHIRFRDQPVELALTGQIYASLEGVYKVKEGDLVVMSFPSGATRFPPRYYVLLVGPDGMTDLTGSDFGSSDGTIKATQRDDEVHFDLGFQKRQKKRAIYKNGTVTVDIRPEATLPRACTHKRADVGFWGLSGNLPLDHSITGFDPEQTSGVQCNPARLQVGWRTR